MDLEMRGKNQKLAQAVDLYIATLKSSPTTIFSFESGVRRKGSKVWVTYTELADSQ